MANDDNKGFVPYQHESGRPIVTKERRVASGYTTGTGGIHKGSLVKEAADATWELAAPGDAVDSVAMGFRYTDPTTGMEIRSDFLPDGITYTGTGVYPKDGSYMTIVDDAFHVDYIGQLDGAIAAPVDEKETLNFDMVQTAADTRFTSGQEIDASSADDASAQLRGRFFYENPKNDPTLTHAKLIVRINESQSDPAQTTTAVGTP